MPGQQPRTQYAEANPEALPECVGRRGGRRVRDGRQRFPSRFFFCPAKRCGKRTADAGRNDDAMRLGPAWASKERFSRPERRILHGGRPYMAWNGHGVQPASSVLTFTAGVHACYQFIRFTHLKFSKPMAVLCIDEKVWQAFVGRLETLAERARLLEHRYEPRTDSS